MSAHIQAWCPSCGMVRTDYEPLPFCRHNIEATAPHPARRMEPLPRYHPTPRGGVSPSGADEPGETPT